MNSNAILPLNEDIFKRVKEISFPDVLSSFHGVEPKRGKIPCPFHGPEQTPSFHVYPDGFKCFGGCGAAGDGITFVAKLLNLRPIDAAKLIAERFNIPIEDKPLTRQDKLRIAQERAARLREQRLQEAFDKWCREAQERARVLAEAIRGEMDRHGVDIPSEVLGLVHLLPLFEYWAEVLGQGTVEERAELFKSDDLRWWLDGNIKNTN